MEENQSSDLNLVDILVVAAPTTPPVSSSLCIILPEGSLRLVVEILKPPKWLGNCPAKDIIDDQEGPVHTRSIVLSST